MMSKILSAALLLSVTSLYADYVSEFSMNGANSTFLYKDANHFKMSNSFGDAKNEIYTIDDKTYMLTQKGEQVRIVDMAQMIEMQKAMGVDMQATQKIAKQSAEDSIAKMKITKTGKKVKIAGVDAEVWNVLTDAAGTQEIVVTNDKNVVTSYHAMLSDISGMGAMRLSMEPQKGYVIIKTPGFELISIEEKKVDTSEYQLPKDVKVEDLSAAMKFMSK